MEEKDEEESAGISQLSFMLSGYLSGPFVAPFYIPDETTAHRHNLTLSSRCVRLCACVCMCVCVWLGTYYAIKVYSKTHELQVFLPVASSHQHPFISHLTHPSPQD